MERSQDDRPSDTVQALKTSSGSHPALRIKLGQILLGSNIIEPEELDEALKIAQDSQEPIGKVLLMLTYVEPRSLQEALFTQSLIAEGVVDQNLAMQALRNAVVKEISLSDAIAELDIQPQALEEDDHELDDLLLRSKLITEEAYKLARKTSDESGIPIGRSLVLLNCIRFHHLNFALECLSVVRAGRMTTDDAIHILTEVKENNLTLEEAMKRVRISPRIFSRLKLGEILTGGQVINERERLSMVERALHEKRLLAMFSLNPIDQPWHFADRIDFAKSCSQRCD